MFCFNGSLRKNPISGKAAERGSERGSIACQERVAARAAASSRPWDPLFTCGEACRSRDDIWPFFLSGKICQIEHYRGQISTGTWVVEAIEFKFEVRSDLRGHLEAAMASEATI